MVLGMFLLAVLFLPLLIILKFKSSEENNRSIVLSSIAGVASLLLCCGIVFKILHWPYAQILTIAGGVLLVLGYLPIYFISVYKATTNKINATATVTLIIAGVGLFVAQSNLGLSRPVSDTFWRGIVESNQLLSHLKKENELFYTKLENKIIAGDSSKSIDSIRELKSNTDALVNYIDDMKIYLIANTEGLSEADAKKIQLDALRKSGGIEIIQSILFNKGSSKFSSTDLKSRIENYKHLIKASSTTIDLSILETGMLEVYDKQVTWEQSNFDQLPIALVIFNLNRIELALKNIESSALIHLS
jgi:hypothetical protein